MESLEASWNSFNEAMPIEESEVMAQLLGAYPFPIDQCGEDSNLGISSIFQSNYDHPSLYHWPQGNCSSSGSSGASLLAPHSDHESYYLSDSNATPAINTSCIPTDVYTAEEEVNPLFLQNVVSHDQFEDPIWLNETSSDSPGNLSLKRKFHIVQVDVPTENPKKKARASMQVHKSSKNATLKNAQKGVKRSVDMEDSNAGSNGLSSSCYVSEDDSSASQELNGGGCASSSSKASAALNSNGKKRASRGSATDPQSLYARKRREKINNRLRILQNLVPNGTKVDISTMLEEAVQYVKFLQLQIKLLSSDELWMYAPIAYNGMNIGLDLKISPLQQ